MRDLHKSTSVPFRPGWEENESARIPVLHRPQEGRDGEKRAENFAFLNERVILEFLRENRTKFGWAGWEVLGYTARPVKVSKTGGKSVVGFDIELRDARTSETARASIVGVWRPDGLGNAIFRLLTDLWRSGFDGRDHLRICKPIAYVEEQHLLLLSRAEGVLLEEALKENDASLESCIARAAAWAAKLHRRRLLSAKRWSAKKEARVLMDWLRHLNSLVPGPSDPVRDLVDQILAAELSSGVTSFALTHGDYHPENIFVDSVDVTVTDFERSSIFDPASDLGTFVAQMTMKARGGRYPISANRVKALRNLFLEAYSKTGSSDVLQRVPLYEARTYLEVLHYVYWGLGVRLDHEDFKFWVNQAEERLREGA